MPRPKYNAIRSGGFDSRRERKRYEELKTLEAEGVITDLQRQVPFELIPKQTLPQPYQQGKRTIKTERAVRYFADFTYMKDGALIVEDSKGFKTADYIIKRKLMLYVHGIQIKEV